MQARKYFLSFINKISKNARKSTNMHIFTSYQKKFEDRTKSYFLYIENGIELYKYVFPKAMKIQFVSSIFIIILASSCDVGCH